MSVASSTESKKANHSYILKRYGYYKSSCKELTILNDELYQELHTVKNKLELKTLELNDASSLVEEKTKELENMAIEMCNSWWCPKHSNLATVFKKLDIKTLNDKIEIDQAIKRQRYWSRQGEVRCVFNRKSGVDKHADPPNYVSSSDEDL
ncbi:putative UDP-N-acetylglucosamine--peptide N-acetylglucosaminyltransferase SEC [Aphis craccivora]|uniref:Putative UDP-N-acetylglucosamine--peptide N-acetylglucosaminyltransferase SEC n=1 Tax=Aphis craccivora TaxID=307492 RepID=A0A6G0VZM5_APHCR|nr:putative UDP-N-acetylglucosamine--peptide N-acetylglucosaminyltransferase SEC [Aphis craccivora]